MASQFTLRPLLRVSRPAFHRHHPIARITTTARAPYTAAAATAAKPAPAKPVPAKPAAAKAIPIKKATPIAAKPASPPPPSPSPEPSDADASSSSPIPFPPAPPPSASDGSIDWATSYYGLGTARFPKEVVDILLQPVALEDVEVKPDGIIYLPEIKYRRILNAAFGPGGWGLVPKGDVVVGEKVVTREYALIAEGRFISQAQGENNYFGVEALPSAVEGCKSNALMRCCKDLGIASDLWDPIFIRKFRKEYAEEIWVEHVVTKKRKTIWSRKDVPVVAYPYKRTP